MGRGRESLRPLRIILYCNEIIFSPVVFPYLYRKIVRLFSTLINPGTPVQASRVLPGDADFVMFELPDVLTEVYSKRTDEVSLNTSIQRNATSVSTARNLNVVGSVTIPVSNRINHPDFNTISPQ